MNIEYISSKQVDQGRWADDGIIVVMPFIDAPKAQRAAKLMAARAGVDGLILAVHDDEAAGYTATANLAFQHTTSPLFAYVAEDAFAGRQWLHHGLTAFQNPAIHMLAFNDGKWFGALASFGLIRRNWAQKNYGGPLFHSGYKSHYGDVELTLIATAQNALAYVASSVLIEVDWDKEQKSVDKSDQALFRKRAKEGFDGKVNNPALLSRFS